MPLTKYTYSISTDFPNAKVNSDSLTVEIDDSTVVGLSHIDTHADDCDIWFHNALDPGSKTVLDGIVAAHQGEPLPPLVKRAIGESLGEITTNTTTWWEKLTVLLVRVEPGTFKIHWTCQFQNSRNKSIKLRIQVDNSITVMDIEEFSVNPGNGIPQTASGFCFVDLPGGSHFVDFDFASSHRRNSISISDVRLEVEVV